LPTGQVPVLTYAPALLAKQILFSVVSVRDCVSVSVCPSTDN